MKQSWNSLTSPAPMNFLRCVLHRASATRPLGEPKSLVAPNIKSNRPDTVATSSMTAVSQRSIENERARVRGGHRMQTEAEGGRRRQRVAIRTCLFQWL